MDPNEQASHVELQPSIQNSASSTSSRLSLLPDVYHHSGHHEIQNIPNPSPNHYHDPSTSYSGYQSSNPYHSGSSIYPYNPPPPPPPPPLRAEPRKSLTRIPWLISSIIVACLVVFIVTMAVNNCPGHLHRQRHCVMQFLGRLSFEPLNVNPMFGPTSRTLLKMGALNSNMVKFYGQGWRLVSCTWLHAGVVHMVSNLLGISFLGVRIEQEFGIVRTAVLYLLSGFSSAVFSALFLGDSISVGASGALFGLVGATVAELLMNWGLYQNRVHALVTLFFLIVINLAVGLLPFVDNFAHIGGLVAGFLLGLVLLVKPQMGWVDSNDSSALAAAAIAAAHSELGGVPHTKKHSTCQTWARAFAAIVFLALFVTGTVVLFSKSDVAKSCSWCHYLSCIPTDFWSCKPDPPAAQGAGPICQVVKYKNGTGSIKCPNLSVTVLGNLTTYSDYGLRVLCTQTCA